MYRLSVPWPFGGGPKQIMQCRCRKTPVTPRFYPALGTNRGRQFRLGLPLAMNRCHPLRPSEASPNIGPTFAIRSAAHTFSLLLSLPSFVVPRALPPSLALQRQWAPPEIPSPSAYSWQCVPASRSPSPPNTIRSVSSGLVVLRVDRSLLPRHSFVSQKCGLCLLSESFQLPFT
ncbi:hypothetical protein EDB89DRAFT_1936118 [Lactarius sanguifluus]|nr:hypothetical protein EDB89DRAFT_1936118 [Lactarius sanguifluus]